MTDNTERKVVVNQPCTESRALCKGRNIVEPPNMLQRTDGDRAMVNNPTRIESLCREGPRRPVDMPESGLLFVKEEWRLQIETKDVVAEHDASQDMHKVRERALPEKT
jgi:hypothetical protein